MIVPIMMLAITEAVMDMSPYVRKTAAHAIPKLNRSDRVFPRFIFGDAIFLGMKLLLPCLSSR